MSPLLIPSDRVMQGAAATAVPGVTPNATTTRRVFLLLLLLLMK